MPRTAVLVLVRRGGRVLAVTRKNSPKLGIPGGKRELGETRQAAAVREVLEETGMVIDPRTLVEVLRDYDDYGNMVITFTAPDPGGDPHPGNGEGACSFVPWSVLVDPSTGAFPVYNTKLRKVVSVDAAALLTLAMQGIRRVHDAEPEVFQDPHVGSLIARIVHDSIALLDRSGFDVAFDLKHKERLP